MWNDLSSSKKTPSPLGLPSGAGMVCQCPSENSLMIRLCCNHCKGLAQKNQIVLQSWSKFSSCFLLSFFFPLFFFFFFWLPSFLVCFFSLSFFAYSSCSFTHQSWAIFKTIWKPEYARFMDEWCCLPERNVARYFKRLSKCNLMEMLDLNSYLTQKLWTCELSSRQWKGFWSLVS